MKKYKGFAYPVFKNSYGFFYASDDISQVKANMLTIINTRPGERVMEPLFGVSLHRLDLNKPKEILEEEAKSMIAEALRTWEPRFPVTNLDTRLVNSDLQIMLTFIDPTNLEEEHLFSLQIPIGK